MKFYLAPLEGLTTYVYRNVYHHFFHPMDKYFTPFIVPHPNRGFKPKELKEILPQHNQGLCVVPQILTNNAEFPIVKDTTPNMMNPRLYTTSYNKP